MSWSDLSLRAKRVTLWTGAFTGVMAAAGALATGIVATEPYHPATHSFVRDEITRSLDIQVRRVEGIEKGQAEGQLETVELRRATIEKELFELDVTMQSQPNLSDSIKSQLNARRSMLHDDKKLLDFRYDTLQRARSGRRP